jgi:hypothetical protein
MLNEFLSQVLFGFLKDSSRGQQFKEINFFFGFDGFSFLLSFLTFAEISQILINPVFYERALCSQQAHMGKNGWKLLPVNADCGFSLFLSLPCRSILSILACVRLF